ncbi:ATP-NAD kinase [Martensiomyces pterosporus]|nr:ATP-NAD kinase [Martensiomyces pterosporus]
MRRTGADTPTVDLVETAVSVREVSKLIGRTVVQMNNVRRIMIVTKPNDTSLISLTRDLAIWLMESATEESAQPLVVYIEEYVAQHRNFNLPRVHKKHPISQTNIQLWTPQLCATSPELFDFVVTLGGDGTVLYTSWLFQTTVPPIIPFHLGSLGFLTVFDHRHARRVLGSAIHAGVRINLRMRFTCTVYRLADTVDPQRANRGESFQVMNELVVDRGPSPYLSQIELYGDGNHLTTVEADGLCLATPTGSTAYSLAAGGSLVHPEIPAILVTPICPHTLSFRPMLLPDSMVLRVVLPPDSRNTAWASFDGRHRIELRRGDHIQITASKYPLPTVCASQSQTQDWMASLSRCLNWNERKRQKKFSSTGGDAGQGKMDDGLSDDGGNAEDEDSALEDDDYDDHAQPFY